MSDNDKLNIANRLKELGKLEDGWLDGDGEALPADGLEWLAAAFAKYYPDDMPRPYLYPTPTSGISAEWVLGNGWEVSANIDLNTRKANFIVWWMDDDEIMAGLNLNTPDGWLDLECAIRRAMEAEE